MSVLSLVLAIGLALVHGALRFSRPRTDAGLSLAGGVTVGYVMIRILPNLCLAHEIAQRTDELGWAFLERRIYILTLAGLVGYYVLQKGRKLGSAAGGGNAPAGLNYWLHIAGNVALSLLVGYLLVRRPPGAANVLVFSVAMASFFLRYDSGLRRDYGAPFDRSGRWVLAAAVLAGWLVGTATPLPLGAVAALFAFLAGAILMITLREEVPEEAGSRPWAFALGAAIVTLLQTAAG